ncbi:MAG: hypothetical protein GX153_03160 [Clostridiaceae bacterium]|jgi:hypothetical protein|nr:hypothetical protein [Clostridiaceae bacterium]
MANLYLDLLTTWCDRLVSLQMYGTGDPRLDGGILCPACKIMHGRADNAIRPLMLLADRTGDPRYLTAAMRLFDWQANMLCDDGSLYNDPNSEWRGITVFSAIGLCEALDRYGHLLPPAVRGQWEARLAWMGSWLYETIDEDYPTNINYPVSNAAAMALLGRKFDRPDYIARARRLAAYSMAHFTPEGLLWGEGRPREALTPRGCRPVDIGYNAEESLPALVLYARESGEDGLLTRLTDILLRQLEFMIPDGGWDNSFGSRNNKWTYWGSRTSDGCQGAYAVLCDLHPAFAEAALRNTRLLAACTHDGLLHGGLHYHSHGEPPCVHHTITHANALAAALECGAKDGGEGPAVPLPCDHPAPLRHYPEIDTWKIAVGDWHATVTGYDFGIDAGHATGGTLTLLWHRRLGPVIASSVVDYRLVEPLNMQLPLNRARHRPLTPRVERLSGKRRYAQCYDTRADIRAEQSPGAVSMQVDASLVDLEQVPADPPATCRLSYRFTANSVEILGKMEGRFDDAVFVLPIIAEGAIVESPNAEPDPAHIFFLTGGFGAREVRIRPDPDGCFEVRIRA